MKFREVRWVSPAGLAFSSEIQEGVTRNLIAVVTLIAGLWIIGNTLLRSGEIPPSLIPISALGLLVVAGVLKLSNQRSLLTQVTWLLVYSGVVTFALLFLRIPEIVYLYVLAPLMAVALVGWPAALGAGALTTGILLAITLSPGIPIIPVSSVWMVVFGEILFGFAGWALTSPLFSIVAWAVDHYGSALQNLEEARNQRVEMKQIQEDLILANQELARLTRHLKIMTDKAEEARRTKEEFVANVSHELRTPLNMIIGYADLIIKSPKSYGKNLPSRLLADISAIQRNSEHLIELVNDVLDLSQVDASKMAMTRQWVSIQETIEAALEAIKPLFVSKNLYLAKQLPTEKIMVYCDTTRIREVVLNLLSNAGRYTDRGGVTVKVLCEEQHVTVSVSDTGRGIAAEDRERIFEPFQQLDSILHHQTGGSGLGLSISKRFIEMHDGKMWLESEVGKGTVFYFSIPITDYLDEPPGPGANRWINPYLDYNTRTRPFKAERPETAPRFVVVEKEKTIQRLFNRYLNQLEVVSFSSLADAVMDIEHTPAQMLIINAPTGAGEPSFAQTALFDTPVITCWLPGREEAARQLGVVRYLLKPIQQEVLLSALDAFDKSALDILLVDDDRETLHLFARIISAARPACHVLRANDGKEALSLMRQRQPDLILLDLIMPKMDGFQVLHEKANDPQIRDIPVIVISSKDPMG